MLVTIEIDLGSLADEWEAVAYRPPGRGERYAIASEKVVLSTVDGINGESYLIVRRKWVWPSWLKARWYCEDGDGIQRCCKSTKPEAGEMTWRSDNLLRIDPEFVDIPKIGGDWRQSLRENPNWRPDNGQKDT